MEPDNDILKDYERMKKAEKIRAQKRKDYILKTYDRINTTLPKGSADAIRAAFPGLSYSEVLKILLKAYGVKIPE